MQVRAVFSFACWQAAAILLTLVREQKFKLGHFVGGRLLRKFRCCKEHFVIVVVDRRWHSSLLKGSLNSLV